MHSLLSYSGCTGGKRRTFDWIRPSQTKEEIIRPDASKPKQGRDHSTGFFQAKPGERSFDRISPSQPKTRSFHGINPSQPSMLKLILFLGALKNMNRLRWSRGSVLAFSTQVRGFKPGRRRLIFRVRKSSARLPSEGK